MDEKSVTLKPGREKSVLRDHPWIFSGAISRVEGEPRAGSTVAVRDSHGDTLATGAYSPESNIRVRLWSRQEEAQIDRSFFHERIAQAVEFRSGQGLADGDNNACRLVFAESDRIPGLIVDRYNQTLVTQFLSAGVVRWQPEIIEELSRITGLTQIYERSDVAVRRLEGLPARSGPLLGAAPDEPIRIQEAGLHYLVDVVHGHKTGFYLDQRENRKRVRALSKGREVLNGFAYTGAFTVAALAGGARSTLSIESSHEAIELGKKNLELNGLDLNEWIAGDVFSELRTLRDRGRTFDLIVLDPPKFAATRRQAESAARGYKDINLLALKLLRPEGLLVTFSCSGGIDAGLFQKIVAGAARDAGAKAQILERLSQGPDHPAGLHFPESNYLKGLVIRKLA